MTISVHTSVDVRPGVICRKEMYFLSPLAESARLDFFTYVEELGLLGHRCTILRFSKLRTTFPSEQIWLL